VGSSIRICATKIAARWADPSEKAVLPTADTLPLARQAAAGLLPQSIIGDKSQLRRALLDEQALKEISEVVVKAGHQKATACLRSCLNLALWARMPAG